MSYIFNYLNISCSKQFIFRIAKFQQKVCMSSFEHSENLACYKISRVKNLILYGGVDIIRC